jgi:sulfur carrier protein ThiS
MPAATPAANPALTLSGRAAQNRRMPTDLAPTPAAHQATEAVALGAVTVEFAPALRRHIPCAPQSVAPGALGAVLDAALLAAPELAHYVFDDQHAVRKHVAVFINRTLVQDRQRLTQPVAAGDRVLVVQALSGG